MTKQELHTKECRMKDAQEKAEKRPHAGWLKEEAKEKELEYLRAKVEHEENKRIYGDY